MELTLLSRSDYNTELVLSDGSILYTVDTPFTIFTGRHTTIRRSAGPPGPQQHLTKTDVGYIEIRSLFGSTIVNCNGSDITPHQVGFFRHSEKFTATNSVEYIWKISEFDGDATLYVNDGSEAPIAFFRTGSFWTGSSSKLAIYNLGIPIADDIVTTLIYMEQKRRRRKQRAAASA